MFAQCQVPRNYRSNGPPTWHVCCTEGHLTDHFFSNPKSFSDLVKALQGYGGPKLCSDAHIVLIWIYFKFWYMCHWLLVVLKLSSFQFITLQRQSHVFISSLFCNNILSIYVFTTMWVNIVKHLALESKLWAKWTKGIVL